MKRSIDKAHVNENSEDEVVIKMEIQDDAGKFYRTLENAGHFFDAVVPRDVEQNAYVSRAMRDGWQI